MREERYSTLLPIESLKRDSITIVGVGAIGRQVAVQLASMGAENLKIIDFDMIDESNLGTQGWLDGDVGLPKVDALLAHLKRVNPECRVDPCARRFKRSSDAGADVVFACVDSMSARKMIFEATTGNVDLFLDGRMSAEGFRTFAVTKKNGGIDYYKNSLFGDNEATQGPCTARSTIYCSNIVSGMLVSLYTQHLRGMGVPKEVEMSIIGMGMEVIF